MFVKIATFAFTAAFIATATATDEAWNDFLANDVWNGLVASWDRNTSTHFYHLPQTLEAAKNEGWTNITGVNASESITPLGFEGDPTFVLLFYREKVIGCQIAILVEDIQKLTQPVQWDELDVIITKTLNDELFYTATVYFYQNEIENTRRIWFQEKTGLHEIPTNASLITSETDFLMKNCVPTMGTHYYPLNSTTDCATLNPWFLLTRDDYVIGVGIQSFGQPTTIGYRKWWETIPDGGLNIAISDPPSCVSDAVAEFGIISLHVWFVDEPQNITCG